MNEKVHKENYKKIKDDIKKEVSNCPKHKSDKAQTYALGGVGLTGLMGSAGAEAFELGVDFLGGHVAEMVGGGTGISIIIFFLFKFFSIEHEQSH